MSRQQQCICLKCIGDESLRKIVAEDTIEVQCRYCGQKTRGILLQTLAEIVDQPLRDHCCVGEEAPNFRNESFEQEGDSLEYFLQNELGIDYDPVKDLIQILEENDPADPRDGGVPFYSEDQNYVRKRGTSGEYHYNWKEFTDRIKYQRRFFDETAKIQLAMILGEPKSSKADELPVLEIGLGTGVELLFRARLANSEQKVKEILKNPILELGSPPKEKAIAGRMNPVGISVFYGAFSEDTAIAEVRPSVGSWVIAGCFRTLRKLRLLNLPLINAGFTGSIFHPDYEDRLARVRFLEIFHALIARPIQSQEEPLEYIPTQAVAEYVSNVLGLDGILYASAQVGVALDDPEPSSGIRMRELNGNELSPYNVVLFEKAAIVKQKEGNEAGENSSGMTAALDYQTDSAEVVWVNGVKYNFERTFNYMGKSDF